MQNEDLISAVFELERLAIKLAFMDFGQQGFKEKVDELATRRMAIVSGIRALAQRRRLSPQSLAKLDTIRERRAKIAGEPCPF